MVEPKRGDIWWVRLDPTQGTEIQKTRPCVILTMNALNRHRRTVVVIPLSSREQASPPLSIAIICKGKKSIAVIDQIRAIDKSRLASFIEAAPTDALEKIEEALAEILQIR